MRTKEMQPFIFSESDYYELRESYAGFCTSCGAEVYGVEPDARKYKCEECGQNSVFGIEELLMMGKVEISCD